MTSEIVASSDVERLAAAVAVLCDLPLPASAGAVVMELEQRGYRTVEQVWNARRTVLVGDFVSSIAGIDGSWAQEAGSVVLLNVFECQCISSAHVEMTEAAINVRDLLTNDFGACSTDETGAHVWKCAARRVSLQVHGRDGEPGMLHISIRIHLTRSGSALRGAGTRPVPLHADDRATSLRQA